VLAAAAGAPSAWSGSAELRGCDGQLERRGAGAAGAAGWLSPAAELARHGCTASAVELNSLGGWALTGALRWGTEQRRAGQGLVCAERAAAVWFAEWRVFLAAERGQRRATRLRSRESFRSAKLLPASATTSGPDWGSAVTEARADERQDGGNLRSSEHRLLPRHHVVILGRRLPSSVPSDSL
jgi:hypothetical protein